MANRNALLVTYTMTDPAAVGVFFRALRIAAELHERGWNCVIVNHGRTPEDPKVDAARRYCEIIDLQTGDGARDYSLAMPIFKRVAPEVIFFGEYPMAFIEPFFDASRALVKPPLLVMDQYYDPGSGLRLRGVDYFLMYGLRALWPEHKARNRTFRIVPPFIDRVTPKPELPVPAKFAEMPWVLVAGWEKRVLQAGIDILAKLRGTEVLGITLSHDPGLAETMMEEAGVPAERRLALPLQHDADFFGLIAASRAVVLANGFMQMAEAVALGCPAVCVHRGIGMDGHTVHEAFRPFVSFDNDTDERVRRVDGWIRATPFSDAQLAALQRERGGARITADYLEHAAGKPRLSARVQRYAARLVSQR
jgi:hypothetical protein